MFALESLLGVGGNMVVSIYRRFAEFFSGGDSRVWHYSHLSLVLEAISIPICCLKSLC